MDGYTGDSFLFLCFILGFVVVVVLEEAVSRTGERSSYFCYAIDRHWWLPRKQLQTLLRLHGGRSLYFRFFPKLEQVRTPFYHSAPKGFKQQLEEAVAQWTPSQMGFHSGPRVLQSA